LSVPSLLGTLPCGCHSRSSPIPQFKPVNVYRKRDSFRASFSDDCRWVTDKLEVIGSSVGLDRETRMSSVLDFLTRCRLAGTNPANFLDLRFLLAVGTCPARRIRWELLRFHSKLEKSSD
jgi:hypothetical protein